MQSEIKTIPALTTKVERIIYEDLILEPAKRVLHLELTEEEAGFLLALTGNRNTPQNKGFNRLGEDLYHACLEFLGVDYADQLKGQACDLHLAEQKRFEFLKINGMDRI